MILEEKDEAENMLQLDEEFLDNLERFNKAKKTDQNIPSPTDLNHEVAAKIKLPNLQFVNYDKEPVKLKVTNTGKSVIVSGKWNSNEHPYLLGGPLNGKYIFSMIIFHWGKKAKYGSFHTVQKIRRAIEIQVIHFKIKYLKLEEAAKHDDGIAVVSYIYEVRFQMNLNIERILLALDEIRQAECSICVDTFQLKKLLPPFENDYFSYNGKLILQTNECFKNVIWMIPRKLHYISFYQIKRFSRLLTKELLPIKKTLPPKQDTIYKPTLFLVNPTQDKMITTCLPMPFYKDLVNICDK